MYRSRHNACLVRWQRLHLRGQAIRELIAIDLCRVCPGTTHGNMSASLPAAVESNMCTQVAALSALLHDGSNMCLNTTNGLSEQTTISSLTLQHMVYPHRLHPGSTERLHLRERPSPRKADDEPLYQHIPLVMCDVAVPPGSKLA